MALPAGESCAAWVAIHLIGFYNDVAAIWAKLRNDPDLQKLGPGEGFPDGVEYLWRGDDKSIQPILLSAPAYMDKVLEWSCDQLSDTSKFPDMKNQSLEDNNTIQLLKRPEFAMLCGKVFRRLFRVYGIIYATMFGYLEEKDTTLRLNERFKHFLFFCFEFGLLAEQELEPLRVLVTPVRLQYYEEKTLLKTSNNKL